MDPALDNFGLHQHALAGDDAAVQHALRQGADVNALDSAGRTAIMCAVAGEHWQNIDASDASFLTPKRLNAIRTLIAHPDISLLTLNCPQTCMNGVVPLGMAAWLNIPSFIRILLEDTADCVAVDGMDSHGATALMYAARDGSLEVVQLLLSHGARPDFRDRNHRTSIQFALAYPRILWLLETVLRRHRWRESKSEDRTKLHTSSNPSRLASLAYSSMPISKDLHPPPESIFTTQAITRLSNALVSSIQRADIPFLHSLLFAPCLPADAPAGLYPMSVPILVNVPDKNGWSCVHHCVGVTSPSVEVLDALYCAGAEMSLFTANQDQQSVLHILAKSARINPTLDDREKEMEREKLQAFTIHLVQDLRAPLGARDKEDETCLHVAAEHGSCVELLALLLELDTTGSVRAMKNSRGLTPMDVSRPEFLHVFQDRPTTSLSTYTIRPTTSFASLASLSELDTFFPPSGSDNDTASLCSSPSGGTNETKKPFDVYTSIQELLRTLRTTSPASFSFTSSSAHSSSHNKPTLAHLTHIETSISTTRHHCDAVLVHFRQRVREVEKMVEDLAGTAERIEGIRRGVVSASKEKVGRRGVVVVQRRGGNGNGGGRRGACSSGGEGRWRHRDSEDSQVTAVSSFVDGFGREGVVASSSVSTTATNHTSAAAMIAATWSASNDFVSPSRLQPSAGLRNVHEEEEGEDPNQKRDGRVSRGVQTGVINQRARVYSHSSAQALSRPSTMQFDYASIAPPVPISRGGLFSDGYVKFVPLHANGSNHIEGFNSHSHSNPPSIYIQDPTSNNSNSGSNPLSQYKDHLQSLWEVEHEMAVIQAKGPAVFQAYTEEASKVVARYKVLMKRKRKLEERIRGMGFEVPVFCASAAGPTMVNSGAVSVVNMGGEVKKEKEKERDVASKVRAWFKKMVVSSSSSSSSSSLSAAPATGLVNGTSPKPLLLQIPPSFSTPSSTNPSPPHSPSTTAPTPAYPLFRPLLPAGKKLEIVYDIMEDRACPVGREVLGKLGDGDEEDGDGDDLEDAIDGCIDGALRTSEVVLDAVERDLQAIGQCLDFARQFIDMANHSISRTQRVVKRAIKKREALITDMHNAILHEAATSNLSPPHSQSRPSSRSDSTTCPSNSNPNSNSNSLGTPGLLGYSMANRPSLASISTIYSDRSSVVSVAATLTENDDDETRIIRRLLLRKIEAQTSGAWDEVDKVMGWLSIVKEAVRAVKRRAYL